jgi:predicted dehydrogenase
MTTTNRIRVGVIGVGFGQHVHVPAFRSDDRALITAICASEEERARTVGARLGIPRAFGDWRLLVSDPEIDAVSISVPPALQADIAQAAAQAGKHIFAEKPLAMNAIEGRAMEVAARASGVVHAVDFEFREVPAWLKCKELVTAGALGRLRQIYLSWRVETRAYREATTGWKRDASLGGGTLNLFVSHLLDAVLWMFGPVARLNARLDPPASAEARVDAWLNLVDGTPVSLSVAADAYHGSGHRIEIHGDEGTLVLENRSSDYIAGFTLALARRQENGFKSVAFTPTPADLDGRIAAVAGMVRRFLDAVEGQEEMRPNFADGLAVQMLSDGIRNAHRVGTWQTLTLR